MPDEPTLPPTIRGQKTRRAILKHALKLFSEKGYKETTVRDIAAAVGIKQGALYNHFANKKAILEALIASLTSSAVVHLFDAYESSGAHNNPKAVLMGIATKFKLISFDKQNEALFKLLMQEIFKNATVRSIYNEHFYQENVKKLSGIFFNMMQSEQIRSADPLLLAHEFFAPLFFYQMQVSMMKSDKKSTSSIVTLFEKHVDFFWESIKIPETKETLF